MRFGLLAAVMAAAALTAGCESSDDKPLPGKRISVLALQQSLLPDPNAQGQFIELPPMTANVDWPQAGGPPDTSIQNLQLGSTVKPVWQVSIGSGISSSRPRLSSPVVADGRIFTMDTEHRVSAFEARNGKEVWRTDLGRKGKETETITGGIAYEGGRLFAATGFNDVVALNAATGKELWRRSVGAPMHGPPTVRDGRLFVTSIDNRLHALRSADGSELWPPYQAIAEAAGLLGSASPAVEGGIVIAPFSSGEVVALRADTGRVLWIDSLATTRRTDELALLSDVRAKPVIDQNQVFAVSYAGLLAAIDVRTGQRIWERETGGLFGPWAAGAYLFFLSNQQELACLSRDTGAVYWVVQLPMFANEKKRKEPILWAGPLLAGDRLIVVSSQGKALFLSPQNGTQLLEQQLPDAVARPPIVVDGTLFVLSDSGELAAYR